MKQTTQLQRAMASRGLTYTKLAAASDVTETFIRMAERGKSGMSVRTLRKVAQALDMSLDDADSLFGGNKAS